ncbi:MAG: metalloregulator ArsR/SmtB family transcription factor [Actinomycetota bacterium]|nr:metalloregulator ArsR/SmtB family transcription factor [Actinomycetota bacterium]
MSTDVATELDAVFDALGDPTRRHVLGVVAASGPISATRIAADLPISRQAVAKHLDVLRDGGLVRADRHGRETRFTLTPDPLADAAEWLTTMGRQWDRRLDRLRSIVERPADG